MTFYDTIKKILLDQNIYEEHIRRMESSDYLYLDHHAQEIDMKKFKHIKFKLINYSDALGFYNGE